MVDSSALWSQLTCSSICQVTHDAAIRLALDGCGGWIAHEMMECLATFMQIFQERGAQPLKNDLISLLAHGEKTRNMTPMELLGNVILLIVGGNDTTRNSMTASVYALNKYPAEYEKLKADHSLIPNMVSETIRWQTPLAHMRRTAAGTP